MKLPESIKIKSKLLLECWGWHPVVMEKYHGEGRYRLANQHGHFDPMTKSYETPYGVWFDAPNLYEPRNMLLAWWLAEWAWENLPEAPLVKKRNEKNFKVFWAKYVRPIKGRNVQDLWLDKILELVLEVGMIESPF